MRPHPEGLPWEPCDFHHVEEHPSQLHETRQRSLLGSLPSSESRTPPTDLPVQLGQPPGAGDGTPASSKPHQIGMVVSSPHHMTTTTPSSSIARVPAAPRGKRARRCRDQAQAQHGNPSRPTPHPDRLLRHRVLPLASDAPSSRREIKEMESRCLADASSSTPPTREVSALAPKWIEPKLRRTKN